MSEYKTLDQFFPDGKPDGRKFVPETYKGSPASSDAYCFQPFYKSNALFWYGLTGKGVSASFYGSNLFKEYTEPKKTKKVKMYAPVYKRIDGSFISADYFFSDKADFKNMDLVVGWIDIDVEVTE